MHILFVCTANVFRSVACEYCLKDYLSRKGITGITVSSAGTHAYPESVHPDVISHLSRLGIPFTSHRQTKLTREVLEQADTVIALAKNHQEWITKHFGIHAPLFNELTLGKFTSVEDINQDWPSRPDYTYHFIGKVVDHIHNSTPALAQRLITFK